MSVGGFHVYTEVAPVRIACFSVKYERQWSAGVIGVHSLSAYVMFPLLC